MQVSIGNIHLKSFYPVEVVPLLPSLPAGKLKMSYIPMDKQRLMHDIKEVMKFAHRYGVVGDNSGAFLREIAENLKWILEDIDEGEYDEC